MGIYSTVNTASKMTPEYYDEDEEKLGNAKQVVATSFVPNCDLESPAELACLKTPG